LRRGVEATGAPALQALLDELTATPESPPEPNQAPGQSAQQTGEPEWSDLNGMPIFTTEYITNVLGLPLEPMSVYEIPLLYPHHLESFESNRGTMIPGQALGFSGTGGFSHFVNAEGIVIFSGIDMYYDYDFNPPHPLAVSLRNATFADVLGMFRIENPEILTLMKDPIGFLDDNYTYTYDSDNGVRNIHYMTDIYRHREEGRGTFARGYVDVNYLVSPDPEYIHQYITVEYYFDDFKLSFIFSDLDSHNIDLYNIELRYINLYYRN
ncbi:MAG: hypothetical protein FWH00_04820, partial [Oscillospiraceae bacterium]|nr:hypothetical protein [Oscillospiraceae bacterium]